MSLNWPKPNHNHASEYQVSGWPFASGSVSVTATAYRIEFPQVVQWFQVNNTSNKDMRVGFTENGVNGSNFVKVIGAADARSTVRFDVKCKEIWVRPDSLSDTSVFSLFGGLTNVDGSEFPIVTGSNGFGGVG